MKKALTYIVIGALSVHAIMMIRNDECGFDKTYKKMKKDCKDTYSKVKALFQ